MEHQIKEFDSLIDLLEDLEREGITGKQKTEIVNNFVFLKARRDKIPYSGGFELTPLCNFDCKMCYVHLSKEQMLQHSSLLSTQQWIRIMEQAVDAGMMYADLTGGECLTYPGFKDIYLYLISQGVRVTILTNGALLTSEWVEFFREFKPFGFQITLYGSDNEEYKNVTGKEAFDEVENAVHMLKAAGLRTKVSITPNRFMNRNVHEIMSYIRGLGVEYAVGAVTLPARLDTGRKINDYSADAELFADFRFDEEQYKQNANNVICNAKKPYEFTVKGLKREMGIPCSSGRCGFHVNWKGEITPCIPFSSIKESILDNGFLIGWQRIQEKMMDFSLPKECDDCKLKHVCTTCPAEKTLGTLSGALNQFVCERLIKTIEKMNMSDQV